MLLELHTIFSNKEELESVPLTKGSELTTHNQITVMRGEQQRDHIQIIQLDDMDHIYKGKITAASLIARLRGTLLTMLTLRFCLGIRKTNM